MFIRFLYNNQDKKSILSGGYNIINEDFMDKGLGGAIKSISIVYLPEEIR